MKPFKKTVSYESNVWTGVRSLASLQTKRLPWLASTIPWHQSQIWLIRVINLGTYGMVCARMTYPTTQLYYVHSGNIEEKDSGYVLKCSDT